MECSDRLTNPDAIRTLKSEFCRHGCLGGARVLDEERANHEELYSVVPLVFGLLPVKVFSRERAHEPIKPAIAEHLGPLGLADDALLIDVLKHVGDQLYYTSDMCPERFRKVKSGMRDLRANRYLYARMCSRQRGRCALCGLVLRRSAEDETLDHIIPFRLIGDVPDGANYQILCGSCNKGKRAYISILQAPATLNWHYNRGEEPIRVPALETRYVLLSRSPKCAACGHGASEAHLTVARNRPTGLFVLDNLSVYCESHAPQV